MNIQSSYFLQVAVCLTIFFVIGFYAPTLAFRSVSAARVKASGIEIKAFETVEETVTLTPGDGDTKTWVHYDESYSDLPYCGPPFKVGPEIDDSGGSVTAGYKHYYDKGAAVFGCPVLLNWNYRGTVWFDLSGIIAKAPPLHVYVKSATLKFKALDVECPIQLLIANKDWSKGYPENQLVPGDPFIKIDSCGREGCSVEVQPVVNNWVRGAEHGGYANNGFVIRGVREGPSKDNDSCMPRYGEFSLTVTYKYEKQPTVLYVPQPKESPVILVAPGVISGGRKNVALASNGATVTAQNYTQDGVISGLHFQPSFAIDGVRHTTPDGGNLWRDEHGLPTYLEVNFGGAKKIDEVDVVTEQVPGYDKAADPAPGQMFTEQGARGFEVQYWNGTAWVTLPGGLIAGNNLVVTKIGFPAVSTTKIRVFVKDSSDSVARIVELEAWGK